MIFLSVFYNKKTRLKDNSLRRVYIHHYTRGTTQIAFTRHSDSNKSYAVTLQLRKTLLTEVFAFSAQKGEASRL